MRRIRWDEADTTETGVGGQVSGVHAASTSPAPNLEQLDEQRLLGSIPLDDLRIDYQPVVDLSTGSTVGYEAQPSCPAHGMRDRRELSARAAMEKKLSELGRAIRALATRDCPHTTLDVPVHPAELRDATIVRPDDPLFSHAAPLRLLLSEPALPAVAIAVLRELRGRSSAQIALDDFGGGTATIKHWIELEPTAVKIDAELISGLDRSRRKQAAVRSIVALGKELGADVIAKGIDCDAEARAAADCGVRFGQGFVLGEPAPLPALSVWPRRR